MDTGRQIPPDRMIKCWPKGGCASIITRVTDQGLGQMVHKEAPKKPEHLGCLQSQPREVAASPWRVNKCSPFSKLLLPFYFPWLIKPFSALPEKCRDWEGFSPILPQIFRDLRQHIKKKKKMENTISSYCKS